MTATRINPFSSQGKGKPTCSNSEPFSRDRVAQGLKWNDGGIGFKMAVAPRV